MLYLSVKFQFASVVFKLRFVTDRRTDGATLICLPKFLWGHKMKSDSLTTGKKGKLDCESVFVRVCIQSSKNVILTFKVN